MSVIPRNVRKELGIDLIYPIMSWLTRENESVNRAKSLSLQYDGFEIDKDTTIAANKRIEEYNQKKRGIYSLFNHYPREIDMRVRKVVKNRKQLEDYIKKTNGKANLTTTVYGFRDLKTKGNRCEYNTAIIPHFVMDFDADQAVRVCVKWILKVLKKSVVKKS